MHAYSQLVEFSVDAVQQTGLVSALVQVDEQYNCSCPGFIGASVQASEDGLRCCIKWSGSRGRIVRRRWRTLNPAFMT